MRLTHLELKRFRSYVGVDFVLNAPRVLYAGLNGVGKSSIRDGIRWAMTGHCLMACSAALIWSSVMQASTFRAPSSRATRLCGSTPGWMVTP